MPDDKVLFVFYTFSDKSGGSWDYTQFPKGWDWIGSGRTYPIYLPSVPLEDRAPVPKYEREEQFNGPQQTKKQMIVYLDKYFSKLKKNGIIKFYKIRQSYKP